MYCMYVPYSAQYATVPCPGSCGLCSQQLPSLWQPEKTVSAPARPYSPAPALVLRTVRKYILSRCYCATDHLRLILGAVWLEACPFRSSGCAYSKLSTRLCHLNIYHLPTIYHLPHTYLSASTSQSLCKPLALTAVPHIPYTVHTHQRASFRSRSWLVRRYQMPGIGAVWYGMVWYGTEYGMWYHPIQV